MVAKDHLLASDKYLKNNLFDKAREEIQIASQVDPTNPYISAFEERLKLFEETYIKRHPNINQQNVPQDNNAMNTMVVAQPQPVMMMNPPVAASIVSPRVSSKEELLTSTIMEMRQQIEELNRALNHERAAREEIVTQQLDAAVRQLRAALEKAWQFGAPKINESEEVKRLVRILNISSDVETSVTREVKLMMYGKAVKEVIAKRKL